MGLFIQLTFWSNQDVGLVISSFFKKANLKLSFRLSQRYPMIERTLCQPLRVTSVLSPVPQDCCFKSPLLNTINSLSYKLWQMMH